MASSSFAGITPFGLDFGTGTVTEVQEGYIGVTIDQLYAGYTNDAGYIITLTTNLYVVTSEQYSALPIDSGDYANSSNLLMDGLWFDSAVDYAITLTIENLPTGTYSLKGYHHRTSIVDNINGADLDTFVAYTYVNSSKRITNLNQSHSTGTSQGGIKQTLYDTPIEIVSGQVLKMIYSTTKTNIINGIDVIPEPSAMGLLIVGDAGIFLARHRRRR